MGAADLALPPQECGQGGKRKEGRKRDGWMEKLSETEAGLQTQL